MMNLSAEMIRYGVTISTIHELIGCSQNTVRNKLNGTTEFSIGEAIKIRDKLFPGMRIEYLFQNEKKTPNGLSAETESPGE